MATDHGHDLWCLQDLDPYMVEVDGRTTLAQAIVRRLITPRGGLLDDPNYGFDVAGQLNGDLDARDLAMLGSNVEAEARKDERVLEASALATLSAGLLTLKVALTDADGPFSLVGVWSSDGLELLKVNT